MSPDRVDLMRGATASHRSDTMTESPQAEPLEFETIDEVLAILRERGHRISTACRLVLEALFAADGPAPRSSSPIGSPSGPRASDLASVYRNLERLERARRRQARPPRARPGPLHAGGLRRAGSSWPASAAGGSQRRSRRSSTRSAARSASGSDTRPASATSRSSGCAPDVRRRRRIAEARDSGHRARHEHEHSHGDYVHSHPHVHGGDGGTHTGAEASGSPFSGPTCGRPDGPPRRHREAGTPAAKLIA